MEGLVCFHLIIIWTMVITLLPQNTESLTRWPEGRTVVPSSRVISTKKGSLRGLYVAWEDKSMSPVEMFLGVPYASPPVGSLRFMPPATVSPWRSTRTTDRYSPVCPQHFPDIANETEALKRMPRGRLEALKKLKPLLANQSEDCLYLNIYAPYTNTFASSSTQRKHYPVIVFIHGESYSWGSGNPYDGSVWAAVGKVIVVTLNYRLGILGFLNPHSDPYSRSIANHGLMDQIAALDWLQENIAEFGGDPGSVTLMGHGTGAACVTFLMTSPAVLDGLFQRAILLSGSALSPWALIQEPTKYALDLARQLNCSNSMGSPTLQLKCLREIPLTELMKTTVETPEFLQAFGPSIDGVVVEYEYAVNKKRLAHLLGRYDLMFGVTQAESFFSFSAEDNQYGIDADRRNRLLRTFVRNTYQFHLREILATIINEYTDWEKSVLHPINIRDETLEALSDGQYIAPLVKTAELHSNQKHLSYFYVFEYQTKASEFPQRSGCVHGEELAYIFGAPMVSWLGHFGDNYTKAEVALSETIMLYWSNFVRTGNPNDGTSSNWESKYDKMKSKIDWLPYDLQHQKYLCFGLKAKMKNHYRSHKVALWTNLIPDLHRTSGDEVARSHHLLDDYNDPHSYNGNVRIVPATLATAPTTTPSPMTSAVNSSLLVDSSRNLIESKRMSNRSGAGGQFKDVQQHSNRATDDHYGAYSTALSVTIAIGCSLLILNVLIFAGVYYQRDKQRLELKRRLEMGMISSSVSGDAVAAQNHHSSVMNTPPAHLCDKSGIVNNSSLYKMDSNASMSAKRPTRDDCASGNVARSSIISLTSPYSQSIAQLPPPEFADFPSDHPTSSSSNGHASMISNTSSFRASHPGTDSSNVQSVQSVVMTATLPRRSAPISCAPTGNEYPSLSNQATRTSSLKRKPNKSVSISAVEDELRV